MTRPTAVLATALVALASVLPTPAGAFVIPAANRADAVHDFKRNRIYITAGDSVLRYDRASSTFLPPVTFTGGVLKGIDVSPDGNRIAVADNSLIGGKVGVHVVDLDTLAVTDVLDAVDAFNYESGSWSVAFGADGSILWTTESNGYSGTRPPLRKSNLATGAVQRLLTITQRTMLVASGDRSRAGFAEANISTGPWGRYTFANGAIDLRDGYGPGTSNFNFEVGTSPKGNQVAIPTNQGTYVYDDVTGLSIVGASYDQQPVGVAYAPVENLAYFPWAGTNRVKIWDMAALREIGSVATSQAFTVPPYPYYIYNAYQMGRTKVSRDGSVLMVTVDGGVEVLDLYAPLSSGVANMRTPQDCAVTFALPGSIGNGGTLAWSLLSQPVSGTLSLSGSTAMYTPNASFTGTDQFTYAVQYGDVQSQGTANITVGGTVAPALARKVDFDGDGRGDLVVRRGDGTYEIRLMQGTLVYATSGAGLTGIGGAPGHVVTVTGDFNGDGKTDLLFQRDDGATEMWLVDGATVTQATQIMGPGLGWSVAHVADFDGDGKSDILWHNANGATSLWLMNGATIVQRGPLMAAGATWSATHVADLNGDGKADIVWRGADGSVSMWLMNGLSTVARAPLATGPTSGTVLDSADLDAFGKSDLLWQAEDGSVARWKICGRAIGAQDAIMPANTNWTITQVADFNLDGKSDLIWLARDGTTGMWLMNGASVLERKTQMSAGTGWTPSLAQDLSGDGAADLVWTNSNGAVGAWVMSGTSVTSRAPLESAGSTNQVVPLRFHH